MRIYDAFRYVSLAMENVLKLVKLVSEAFGLDIYLDKKVFELERNWVVHAVMR